jgi:hypothetical protein
MLNKLINIFFFKMNDKIKIPSAYILLLKTTSYLSV